MIKHCIKRKEELIQKILKGKKNKKVSLWDFDTDREAYEIKLVLDDNTIVVFLSNRSGIDTMDIMVVKYENNKAD